MSDDPLADICPLCGEPIRDGDQWTLRDGEMVHKACDQEIEP